MMITFEIGDIVEACGGNFIGIVFGDGREHEGSMSWAVFWHDGDVTYYEDGESMDHYKIKPEQWTVPLIRFYLDKICP